MDNENGTSSTLFDILKCPITFELFRDPVVGSDGHTYERENITAWIRKHATSPITREPMQLSSLRPNYTVKKLIDDFHSSSVQKQYQFRLNIDVCKAKEQPIFASANKTIYEGRWMLKQGPSIVLIKIDGTRAKHEASFYVKLSCHPHIVRTYGFIDCSSSDSIMLVQEFAPQGDLSERLRENPSGLQNDTLIEIFCQIVDAMVCLADNQIIHGDLACRNVLVFRWNSERTSEILVKLTDFGLTRTSPLFTLIDSTNSSTNNMIPVRSAAPEVLEDPLANNYSEKSDVYSFGVLMWEACSKGARPYGNLRKVEQVYQEKKNGKMLERPKPCSDELWSIIITCLQTNPQQRPNFKFLQEELLKLKFLNHRQSYERSSSTTSSQFSDDDPQTLIYTNEQKTREQTYYQNLTRLKSLSVKYRNQNTLSDNSTRESSGYYMPCEYCMQSLDLDDFETHKNVCPVRKLVKLFAHKVAQLPPLELTFCSTCEEIIPMNMLHFHQNTCDPKFNHLTNRTLNEPSTNSTSIYLRPISFHDVQPPPTYRPFVPPSQRPSLRPPSYNSAVSDYSGCSSEQEIPIPERITKQRKSSLHKAFSKFKKKMT